MHFLKPFFLHFFLNFFWNPFFGTLFSTFFGGLFSISLSDFYGNLFWHSFEYFFMGINFHWHHFEYFEKLQDYFVHFFLAPSHFFLFFYPSFQHAFENVWRGGWTFFWHHLRSSKKYLNFFKLLFDLFHTTFWGHFLAVQDSSIGDLVTH